MRFWWTNLCLLILSLSLFPAVAHSQKAEEASQTVPNSFAIPYKATTMLFRPGNVQFDELQVPMLNELLREANPAEIAAAVFGLPVDKIDVVPHVYWREAKWVDWAAKADQAKRPPPSTGSDGKLVMSAGMTQFSQLQIEFGPVPWGKPSDEEKFARAANLVLERVTAKMVRLAPEFSVNFARRQVMDDFDRLGNRLRDLNGEIEKLRREIGGGSGLSPAQLAERLADLSKQELSTRLSLTVMKARSGAIREQIEKIKAQAGANAAENQTLRTLKRIVEVRKSRFEALKEQYAVGVVPKADVDKAEEEMLSAMVEVDRATAAMQKDASQSQLDQLSSELSKAAVDFAEGDARLRFLDDAVAETEKHLIQRHDIDAKADEAQSRLSALERRRSQLQQQRNNAEDTLNSPIDPLQLTLPER